MVLRTTVVATAVAAAMSFPMAGVAAAQDRDCEDFPTQAAAQEEYNRNPADPYDLDRDNDGRACEALSRGGTTVIIYEDNSDRAPTPTNGVETGAGGTADLVAAAEDSAGETSGPLLELGILGGAVLAAGGLVLVRRRSVRRD